MHRSLFQAYCRCLMSSKLLLFSFSFKKHDFIARYTAISRKVVGKSARNNPERHCGWFLVLCFSKKFERTGTKGHGNVFASAKGKQQK